MNDQARRSSSFGLIADERTSLIILGSLPGRRSLEAREYYANPQNGFWRLLGHVVRRDLRSLPYQDRLTMILAHRIGLWDVIEDAERDGSLDSAIRHARYRDLGATLSGLPALKAVAFNGTKAAKIGLTQIRSKLDHLHVIKLLSSSGACAVPAKNKQADWLRLKEHVDLLQ